MLEESHSNFQYEKQENHKVQGWRKHSGAHQHIHGVCEPTCGIQVSPR